MISAIYRGKNKEYRAEFRTFAVGKKEKITQEQYAVLKLIRDFEFEGQGVDPILEAVRSKEREKAIKEQADFEKAKKSLAARAAKAAESGTSSKLNLKRIKNIQNRLRNLTGK